MNGYKPEGFLLTDHTNYEYTSTMAGLERAMQDGVILEGVALLCDKSYNLHVELGGGIRAIIPREEVQYTAEGEQIKDIAILTRVGKAVCFKVSGISGSGTVMLSRRAAQRQCKEDYISALMPLWDNLASYDRLDLCLTDRSPLGTSRRWGYALHSGKGA